MEGGIEKRDVTAVHHTGHPAAGSPVLSLPALRHISRDVAEIKNGDREEIASRVLIKIGCELGVERRRFTSSGRQNKLSDLSGTS